MRYRAVIFDLDGTLLNTLRDLHAAVNVALKGQGFGEKTLDEVRSYVGNGVRVLFERALPEEAPERREACVAAFKEYYSSHINVYTRPYPGILALLERLQKAGVKTGVCSNKFDAAVRLLCVTPGMTSSTTKIVVSSRHVLSETPPVVVRVVTPRTTEHTPPASSTGVTPPWSSVSSSLSP